MLLFFVTSSWYEASVNPLLGWHSQLAVPFQAPQASHAKRGNDAGAKTSQHATFRSATHAYMAGMHAHCYDAQGAQASGNAEFATDIKVESEHLAKLAEQKTELLTKVQTLKKELTEWRTKLDGQVKSFRGVSSSTICAAAAGSAMHARQCGAAQRAGQCSAHGIQATQSY